MFNLGSGPDEPRRLLKKSMQGHIDPQESLRRKVALLKGTPTTVYDEIKKIVVLQDGAKLDLPSSAGISQNMYNGKWDQMKSLGMPCRSQGDYVDKQIAASTDGKTLTGEVVGSIVDKKMKEELFGTLTAGFAVPEEQVALQIASSNDQTIFCRARCK